MKKIILSVAMLMALATATFAQSNTSTVNQLTGENNTATIVQKGNSNKAAVEQTDATTKGNFATINQLTGKLNDASIIEKGSNNRAIIAQDGLQTPTASGHIAAINIGFATSQNNLLSIAQVGTTMVGSIALTGSNNVVTIDQSGTANKALLLANSGLNNSNTVGITQAGTNNEAYTKIAGSSNKVTVGQAGTTNKIGTYAGGGAFIVGVSIADKPAPASFPTWVPIINNYGNFPGGPGINITGDGNQVTVNQGAATKNNEVGVSIVGANNNTVNIDQLGTAMNNKASVKVAAGQSGNQAIIEQMGTATGNEAGIYQEGSGDYAKITQTGNTNRGGIYQQVGTTIGQNMATLTQSGNGNQGLINQGGTPPIGGSKASMASIDQQSNNNEASIVQKDGGGHEAILVQKTVNGNRFILEQGGADNKLNFTQQGIFGGPSDVEIRQTGIGNTINTLPGSTATVIRYTQVGNGNSISL